ncbi:hypothetical protein MJO29_006889 [Puccinia striiformis f. sp. tritici]|nr:hypothetical protein MJO29_006889 [Puccinia striiformis f. sp. tritici]
MVKASKAVLAQRRRYARENVKRELQKQKSPKENIKKVKKNKVYQNTIVIGSESDDNAIEVLNSESDDNALEVLEEINKNDQYQEAKIIARNQANGLVRYDNLGADKKTSENDSDVTDKDLWPLFSGGILPRQDLAKRRQLKSGQKSYQQLTLCPALVPGSTNCDWKRCQIEALGNNIHMMSRYVIHLEPVKAVAEDPTIDPHLEFAILEEDVSANQNNELINHSLASLSDKHPADPKELQLTKLNSALNADTLHYQKKEKIGKKFELPKSMINNIYLYNNLCLEYTLNGTPCPNATASLLAAQSAIKQCPLSTGP